MLSWVGALLVALGLAASLYALARAALALVRPEGEAGGGGGAPGQAQAALDAAAVLLALALLVLAAAFLANRFELAYVAAHSQRALPGWLKVAAVWAGQGGSLLLWATLQAGLAALVARGGRGLPAAQWRWLVVILAALSALWTGVTLFLANPFAASGAPPEDGAGLNPLLRHPGMAFHPPALYLGFVGLAAPYALALSALLSGHPSGWRGAARRWTLGAWLFLGLGLLLGARWAYDVLGWGGYWAWDPVENAGLLPWLTATALLHALTRPAGRRMSGPVVALASASLTLVLLGAYATRSGALQSVHAYARSQGSEVYLLAAGALVLAPALAWLRRPRALPEPAEPPDHARSAHAWREAAMALTLLTLLLLAGSILVGTLLPALSAALGGVRLEASPEWFDRVTAPQFALLLLTMSVCPLLGRAAAGVRRRGWVALGAGLLGGAGGAALVWAAGLRGAATVAGAGIAGLALGTTLAEAWRLVREGAGARREGRKLGALGVHLGVALMALGVVATRSASAEWHLTLGRGEARQVGGYTLVYEGTTVIPAQDHVAYRASVAVARGGALLARLQPEVRVYEGAPAVAVPAVRSGWRGDLYLVLAGLGPGAERATLGLTLNPLIWCLWAGALALLGGGVLAAWPTAEPLAVPERRREVRRVAAGAVGVVLLAGAALALWGPGLGAASGGGRPALGAAAPEWRVTTLDGEPLALSDLRGRVVVLNVWASWCQACRTELPALQGIWEVLEGRGVTVVGIAVGDDLASARAARERFGLTYPLALDGGGRGAVARAYGVTGVPETFILDAEGRVTAVHVGEVAVQTLLADVGRLLEPLEASQ